MLAEAAPAPVVVEFSYLVVGLGVLVTLLVLIGVKHGYDQTLGALLNKLAEVLDFKVWRFKVDLGEGIRRIGDAIEDGLGKAILANEAVLAKWWQGQKDLIAWTYDSLAWLAHETLAGFDALVHGLIPFTVTTVVAPVKTGLGQLRKALRAEAARLEAQLARRAHALEVELDRDFGMAWRGIDNIRDVSIPRLWRWAAGAAAAIAALRHYAHRVLNRRLSRLEQLIFGAALAGLVLRVLTRHFPYWQCTNVRRFNRLLCRSPFGALDWLFALFAFALVALDPERVVQLAEDAADELGEIIATMAG